VCVCVCVCVCVLLEIEPRTSHVLGIYFILQPIKLILQREKDLYDLKRNQSI
jgi:hypothetical protein